MFSRAAGMWVRGAITLDGPGAVGGPGLGLDGQSASRKSGHQWWDQRHLKHEWSGKSTVLGTLLGKRSSKNPGTEVHKEVEGWGGGRSPALNGSLCLG